MKRFFLLVGGKVGRFFWSWGFLKFVLWAITLIILFYAEEDWRGARVWAATKAKWEAQGETFDILRLAPRLVPEAENLASLPLFKMEPDPNPDPQWHGYLVPLTLQKAFAWDWVASSELPRGGLWEQGKLADAEKNRTLVKAAYAVAFKDAPITTDAFTQFNALLPAIAELRAAAETRPYCRFEQNYRLFPPRESLFRLITEQIALSQYLSADAILALDAKKPEVALADIFTHAGLLSGTLHQPMLVAGLVGIGMEAINQSVIYQGLATHAWNDQQLAELQTRMASIDFLSPYQNDLRGETCIMVAAYDRLKPKREQLVSEIHRNGATVPPTPADQDNWTPFIWPDGWLDLLKSRTANFNLAATHLVNLQKRVASPDSIKQFAVDLEKKRGSHAIFSIWSILSDEAVGPINTVAQKFAIAQVRLDEMRIALALERYHLAHKVYPATLDELAPAYIDSVPHDIIDGKPYHYQARADGTFQLYSVGWNQTDDGGVLAFKNKNPKAIDYENGDWPWPTPK